MNNGNNIKSGDGHHPLLEIFGKHSTLMGEANGGDSKKNNGIVFDGSVCPTQEVIFGLLMEQE